MDWSEIAEKIISGGVLSAAGFVCLWVGRKVGWLFDQTRQNKKDLDAAFLKIRELEGYVYEHE